MKKGKLSSKKYYGLLLTLGVSLAILLQINVFDIPVRKKTNNTYRERPRIDAEGFVGRDIKKSIGVPDQPNARGDFERLRTQSPISHTIPLGIKKKALAFTKSLPKSNFLGSENARSNAVSFSFSLRGPDNVGGRTRALALDASDETEQTILAGGVSGGMWRSTGLGATWTKTTTPDQFPSVVCIVQDTRPDNQNTWYYGTGEIVGNSASSADGSALYRGDGIYKSVDGGQSWAVIENTSDGDITNTDNVFRYVNNLVIDATNQVEDELYAAVIDGIIRTTDGFETYEFVLGNPDNVSLYTDIAITSTGKLYATVSDDSGTNEDIGIWTSDDGIVWEEIALPASVPTSGFQKTSIGISPSDEDIVYFFRTESSGDDFNFFVYDAATDELTVRDQSALPSDLSTQGSYDQYVRVHPDDPEIVFLGAVELYRSTNGFEDNSTTQRIGGYPVTQATDAFTYINHHPDQHAMVFFPGNSNQCISAHDGGLSLTFNNLKASTTTDSYNDPLTGDPISDDVVVEWENINNGYHTSQFYTVAIADKDLAFPWLSGGLQDNSTVISFTETDPNEDWATVFGGDGSYTQITNNSLIASAQFAQAVRHTIVNDGTETDLIYPPNAGSSSDFLFVNPILADPILPNRVFIAGRGSIYYTFDVTENPNGNDWLAMAEDELARNEIVTTMEATVSPENQLLFGTYNTNNGESRILRVEDTNDPDEIADLTGTNLPDGWISCIAVDTRNSDNISIIYSNYEVISVYNSQDGGLSWVPVAGNLEENPDGTGSGASTRWMEIMPNGETDIYLLGTSTGLYYTEAFDDENTEWTQAGENEIGNVVVDMLAIRPIDGFMAVSTHGNGVYQTTLDVPMQSAIYLEDYTCANQSFTVVANQDFSESGVRLRYEWFEDGQLVDGLNASFMTATLSDDVVIQARVTNIETGESSLSNELTLSPLSNDYCNSVRETILSTAATLSEVEIYPNPAVAMLNISGGRINEADYQVLDLGGRKLSSGIIKDNTLDVSSLVNGTYLLLLEVEGEHVTKKFIKR